MTVKDLRTFLFPVKKLSEKIRRAVSRHFFRQKSPKFSYDYFEVWFRINDQNSKGGWKNVRLKRTFSSEKELRSWLQEYTDGIIRQLDLHFLEK